MQEIKPPWIQSPGYSPGDTFWRQSGEIWFHEVWIKYWQTLSVAEKQEYLERWQAPQEWLLYCEYINPDFQAWLDSID